MSQIEPHAPNLASHAPNTIRPTCVCRHAPAHIGHGSKVTINVQSARFHVPSDRAACVMAFTSQLDRKSHVVTPLHIRHYTVPFT